MLTKSQKNKIAKVYEDNPLLKAMYQPLKQWENKLQYIKLSPEECFIYLVEQLEKYRRSKNKVFDFSDLWDKVYADFDDGHVEHKEEITFATSIVICVLYVYLSKYPNTPPELLFELTQQLVRNTSPQEVSKRIKTLLGNIALFGEETFTAAIEEYIESQLELSKAIYDLIETTDEPIVEDDKQQISTRQLVLLFQHLLNVSLDTAYTNQNELATFLSFVSGKSANAIRQMIIECNKDTGSRQTSKDVEFLAKQIRPFNNDIASDLLEIYEK